MHSEGQKRLFPVCHEDELFAALRNEPGLRPGDIDCMKYVDLAREAKRTGERADISEVELIRSKYLQNIKASRTGDERVRYIDAFEELWKTVMRDRFISMPALVRYMLDENMTSSTIFYKALALIAQADSASSAGVIETRYDRAIDVTGDVVRIGKDDPIAKIAVPGGIYYGMRFRDGLAHDAIFDPEIRDISTIGAGLLSEFRCRGGIPLNVLQEKNILAVDRDESLRPMLDKVFGFSHGVSLAETGINYQWCDFGYVFNNPENEKRFALTLSMGTYSYQTKIVDGVPQLDDEAAITLINGLMKITKPGGKVMFDSLIMFDDIRVIIEVFGWRGLPAMMPEPSALFAAKRLTRLLAEVENIESIEYRLEPYRQAAIVPIITKAK